MTTGAALATAIPIVPARRALEPVSTETHVTEPAVRTEVSYPAAVRSLESDEHESEGTRARKRIFDPSDQAFQTTGSASTSPSPVRKSPLRAIDVTVDAEARPYLVSDMAKIRDGLVPLIGHRIAIAGLPARGIRISLKRSPEEDWQELVFRVFVDANVAQGIALWDSIGRGIGRWRLRLSGRTQRLLDEQAGVFVEWV